MGHMSLAGGAISGTMARHAIDAVAISDASALRAERAAIALAEVSTAVLEQTNIMSFEPTSVMQQALTALQAACGSLGAQPGDWRSTEILGDRREFSRRLELVSEQLRSAHIRRRRKCLECRRHRYRPSSRRWPTLRTLIGWAG